MLDESLINQGIVRYFVGGGRLMAVTSIGVNSPTSIIAAPLRVCKVELRVALLDHIGDFD